MNSVDEERIRELCEELRPLLEAELTAGNTIIDTWKGWPWQKSLYIMLAGPFSVRPEDLAAAVRFVAVEDPHYWKSEIVCDRTHHALACGFSR